MEKPLIVSCNVPAFKEWLTNFKLLCQALPCKLALCKHELYNKLIIKIGTYYYWNSLVLLRVVSEACHLDHDCPYSPWMYVAALDKQPKGCKLLENWLILLAVLVFILAMVYGVLTGLQLRSFNIVKLWTKLLPATYGSPSHHPPSVALYIWKDEQFS